MNTPTPAQALGDIGHWLCKYSDDGRYMNLNGPSSRQCFEVGKQLIKHGQHFAGLADDLEREQGVREDAQRQLRAAEARCAELERDNKVMRAADYHQAGIEQEQQIIDLESRVREAEGLLRELVVVWHETARLAGITPPTTPVAESLGGRLAAFLAASGETR